MSTVEARRRARNAYNARNARVNVILKKDTMQALETKAKAYDLPVATYVRRLIEADLYNEDKTE